jgi:hypothetical protein
MTADKKPVDLKAIEPIFHREESEDLGRRDDTAGPVAIAAAGTTPAVGLLADTEDVPPPDPDELDRLRRG